MGELRIAVATSGNSRDLDPDGYLVAVDGMAGQPLPINGSVTFTQVTPGSHTIALSGVAPNCTVSGQNPVATIVAAGGTAKAAFEVVCGPVSTPTGSLEVTASTSGAPADLDQDGYTCAVDGGVGQALPSNGSVTLSQLAEGTHTVTLSGVAPNCTVAGPNPVPVTVPAGGTAHAAFQLACAPINRPADRIAFVSERDGNPEIYSMNPDGTDLTRLTDSSARDVDPAWSPDQAKIVFASTRAGSSLSPLQIYVMNADGSGVTRLTDDAALDHEPAWSPDGTRITFAHLVHGVINRRIVFSSDIYVMNADGSNIVQLTSSGSDHVPHWSADGIKIAFVSTRDGNPEIYVMNADGSGVTRLTQNSASDGDPAWSPDGTKLAFDSDRAGNTEIYLMRTDGSGVTRITNTSAEDEEPAWSPDGSRLAFASGRGGDLEIYVMNADGTGITQLTDNPAADIEPAWRP
jgi:dipeptidyl aminopeptidase/acylaminoacyl peptidase